MSTQGKSGVFEESYCYFATFVPRMRRSVLGRESIAGELQYAFVPCNNVRDAMTNERASERASCWETFFRNAFLRNPPGYRFSETQTLTHEAHAHNKSKQYVESNGSNTYKQIYYMQYALYHAHFIIYFNSLN